MTRHKHIHNDNKGFSLVELMVVLVILTIGLLPLALVQTRASQDVTESGHFSEAVRVAELQMESAKALGFGNIPTDSGTVDGFYTWNRQVTNVSLGLDQIVVGVAWNEKGDQRTVSVRDMISFR
jgi:prepilin-type N-terminal cleavage/methylation domain-containing protein